MMASKEESSQTQDNPRPQKWFRNRHLGVRLLIGTVFVLLLTCFLHWREVRIEVLEFGSVADRYLIAQVDFEFPDEEATVILKQESVRDIGRIYRMDEKQVLKKRYDFEDYLVHNSEWRKRLPKATFEELYYGADQLKDILLQSRFTDERTLAKIKKFDLPSENFYLFTSDQLPGPVNLDESYWEGVEKEIIEQRQISKEGANFLVGFFKNQSWNLSEDISSVRSLRQSIQEGLPEVYTHIEGGSRIIDSGDKVTHRHIAMLHAMKEALKESRNVWEPLSILGSFLLALMFTFFSVIYLHVKHRDLLRSPRKLILLLSVVILTLAFAKATEYLLLSQETKLFEFIAYPLIVPFASLLLCILLGTGVAFFISAFLAIILGVTLAFDHDRFLLINLVASLVAIIYARRLHKRKEIFTVCAKVWVATIPVIIAFNLVQNRLWGMNLGADFASSLVLMVVIAILVIGFLPLFESLFHVMTDMSLMEYMDPNNELLRRLSVEAPGTYQHSLVVGNLAETAARAIGANGLFSRVSALYHDIGKLFNPHYFTENQLGGLNIHQLLTPQESTQVIISHVCEGEMLARKHHLPAGFIDIIRQHHGTTLVYYFYCKQVELMGGDPSKVDEVQFRYPGPKPHSKEAAIVMISDAVEAASRSLSELSEKVITDLVDRLVKEKSDDGQFDECKLSFEELGIVKKTIVQTLLVTHHLRIKYPER